MPLSKPRYAFSGRGPGLLAGPRPRPGLGTTTETKMSSSSAANPDQLILSSFSVSSYGPNISSRPARQMLSPSPGAGLSLDLELLSLRHSRDP